MKRVKSFINHHFSKAELALEEIIIIIVCVVLTLAALAAEALVPVQVNIVRCVTSEERVKMCTERSLCCQYIDEADQDRSSPSEQPAPKPTVHSPRQVYE